jgi:DNA-binding beta-propeller fold protein YncE
MSFLRTSRSALALCAALACLGIAQAAYTNYESSQVHPIALTPSGNRLLVLNTPEARLEIFRVSSSGLPAFERSIGVGLEPVSVRARTETEYWVVNQLSDSISVVDLSVGLVVRTLSVGDEPTDVVFAAGRAFVTSSQQDALRVFDLANLSAAPIDLPLFGQRPRALATSLDGSKVYAVALQSGNQTTVIKQTVIDANVSGARPGVLAQLGLNDVVCSGSPNPYPPLPPGLSRNPALTDPPDGRPKVGLIVRWNNTLARWEDDAGQDWTHCVHYRLPDNDLFVIDAASLSVSAVQHLGTTLFDVSVQPSTGRIYVPHTEARNQVRFEHPLGVRGHIVDNRMAVVDPSAGNQLTLIDLNQHIDRGSDPSANTVQRAVAISQPGMMVWAADGSHGWLTAIGSRKVFRVDGSCLAPNCIFGPSRAVPQAVEVGHGPTGVALHPSLPRLYVLNRFDNAIAVVDTGLLQQVYEVKLFDPAGPTVRAGRINFYDGFSTSRHGDASCASCHISGHLDGLAWDLGDPTGTLAPYSTPGSNVRFVQQNPLTNSADTCTPHCADHAGFDPQKGPMTTQTMRAMIEPLHWRGDRGTVLDFNPAFVGLLGKQNIAPPPQRPAGLSDSEMQKLRTFLLDIRFPPNPHRSVDDTIPSGTVQVPGHSVAGNPTTGQQVFLTAQTDGLTSCVACHTQPFGTHLGKLGGIQSGDPPSPNYAALLRGTRVQSPHSDMKIPQLRNLYEKFGPPIGLPGNPALSKSGFGFSHDGSTPDLASLFAGAPFSVNAQQIKDVTTFILHWPTGTKPAVGRQVTVPAGSAPTGTAAEEQLISLLLTLGDGASASRHCELIASTTIAGGERSFRFSSGVWRPDRSNESLWLPETLRESAEGPITFTCSPLGNGVRLAVDRDEDGFFNRDDCAPVDPTITAAPPEVNGLIVSRSGVEPQLAWPDERGHAGSLVVYDILGGELNSLLENGLGVTTCLASGLPSTEYEDVTTPAQSGDGVFYLVRSRNQCLGTLGTGRESLDQTWCGTGKRGAESIATP